MYFYFIERESLTFYVMSISNRCVCYRIKLPRSFLQYVTYPYSLFLFLPVIWIGTESGRGRNQSRGCRGQGKIRMYYYYSDEDERPRFWISKAALLAYLRDSETGLAKGKETALLCSTVLLVQISLTPFYSEKDEIKYIVAVRHDWMSWR